MKKILLFTFIAVGLCGCNDVDITKYPENIQSCYNDIVYDSHNCTSNKKKVLKYCQCYETKMDKKIAEVDAELRRASASLRIMKARSLNIVYRAQAEALLDKYSNETADTCAAKTGYTRFSKCKKNKKN